VQKRKEKREERKEKKEKRKGKKEKREKRKENREKRKELCFISYVKLSCFTGTNTNPCLPFTVVSFAKEPLFASFEKEQRAPFHIFFAKEPCFTGTTPVKQGSKCVLLKQVSKYVLLSKTYLETCFSKTYLETCSFAKNVPVKQVSKYVLLKSLLKVVPVKQGSFAKNIHESLNMFC